MTSTTGLDKFDGHYVKVFTNLNDSPFMIHFDHGRFQKINESFYWLLCYATSSSPIAFRYKPEMTRLPCYVAVLIKKAEYQTSFKNKEGKYEKAIFSPTPVESWLVDYLNTNNVLLSNNIAVKGFLNLDQRLFTAFADIHGDGSVNPGTFVRFDPLNERFDLPDCDLKMQSSKSAPYPSSGNSSSLLPLDDKSVVDSYEKAITLSQQAYDQLSLKFSAEMELQDLNNLRLAIYLELLRSR